MKRGTEGVTKGPIKILLVGGPLDGLRVKTPWKKKILKIDSDMATPTTETPPADLTYLYELTEEIRLVYKFKGSTNGNT